MDSLQRFLDSILDFVYPPLCVVCSRLLDNRKGYVCPECWGSIQKVHPHLPLYLETRNKLVVTEVVDELVSLFVFEKEGAFQKVVHSLKYSGVQAVGLEIGRRLGALLNEKGVQADALVPIPLHKRKLRERGYNQSELIARGVCEVTSIPLRSDLIRRKKFTQTQTTLSLEERRDNMEEAFACESSGVRGKTVILVDDIITTGSTIQSCAGALKKAGAVRIIAASAALAE
ncbi:MAG: putative amidophosphoribosyltransferase [Bacteroidetes bacterium]|nr:putative amidophosphoribosyltransferase [Bacteroidota bacterium]